jgi:hypothetical protein
MSPEQFCYWLQGFAELQYYQPEKSSPTYTQWMLIKEHLALVFDKKTSKLENLNLFLP